MAEKRFLLTHKKSLSKAALAFDGAWPYPESVTVPELSYVLQLANVSFSLEATKGTSMAKHCKGCQKRKLPQALQELANPAPCSLARRSCRCRCRQGDETTCEVRGFARVPRVAVRALVVGSIVKSSLARPEERARATVKFCSRSSVAVTEGV